MIQYNFQGKELPNKEILGHKILGLTPNEMFNNLRLIISNEWTSW